MSAVQGAGGRGDLMTRLECSVCVSLYVCVYVHYMINYLIIVLYCPAAAGAIKQALCL